MPEVGPPRQVRAVPGKEGASGTTDLAVGVFSGSPKPAPSSEVQPTVRRRLAGERARPCDGGGVAIPPRLCRLLAIALQLGSSGVLPCNHCSINQDAPNSSRGPERSSNSCCDCIASHRSTCFAAVGQGWCLPIGQKTGKLVIRQASVRQSPALGQFLCDNISRQYIRNRTPQARMVICRAAMP